MISRRNKVLLFAAIVICSVVALPLASKYVRRTVLMHRVRRVVTEVEVFQSEHHRLPSTLEELGLNEDPIYYRTDNGRRRPIPPDRPLHFARAIPDFEAHGEREGRSRL